MTVAGKFLAVLLALLVANPVCCCTLGELLGFQPLEQSASTTRSCCAAKKAKEEQSPDTPDKCPSCPCDKDDPVIAEAKTLLPDAIYHSDVVLDPPLAFESAARPTTSPPALVTTLSIPPPPPSWRLHCSFLL